SRTGRKMAQGNRERARMTELVSTYFKSFDGVELQVHQMGAGRPVVLLHGLFSNAETNWIKFGHAQRLVDAGFEVIMPDLRAHGDSATPHNRAAYPDDVLVKDITALVERLGLTDYDLAGFSLGARISVQCVISGLAPRRLVLAGMGLEGLCDWASRREFFIDAIERFDEIKQGEPAFFAVQFMKTMNTDRAAAWMLLESVGDIDRADLAAIAMPTLVVCGDLDRDNGSPEALADALPDAEFRSIPGTHMGSVTGPDLGEAIAAFLSD
ncbi:MAG TPA: alpha/beta fold hydrolase, partial [Sphingomonadaceae bacterium]|nr:alpha/beta fold hydrolase [Sphingomonadaceae bacterium]